MQHHLFHALLSINGVKVCACIVKVDACGVAIIFVHAVQAEEGRVKSVSEGSEHACVGA